MSCPLRPKRKVRFLWWSWYVSQDHDWKILDIGVHMVGVSNSFKVEKKCIHCDKWQLEHFVSHEELLELGFSQEEISSARHHSI